ncbi:Protein SABRE [Microsporum canis]
MFRALGPLPFGMAILSPTTVFVALVLVYISSFVLFAIIRIATGISIQRIGYFSLRHIAYSPREGVHIKFGGIGISIHRPSLVQPTYVSLRIRRATVSLDLKVLASSRRRAAAGQTTEDLSKDGVAPENKSVGDGDGTAKKESASWDKTWKMLKGVKEKLKQLLRQIKWLALIDISATETTLRIRDAGELHVGALTMSLDARRKAMQSGKQFRQNEDASGERRSPEWIFNARNILLALDGCEHKEIFDNIGINVHGLLQNGVEGLREVSISVKVGRLHIPYDDVRSILLRIKGLSLPDNMVTDAATSCEDTDDETALGNIMEESDSELQDTHNEVVAHHLTESKAFVASLLRGIQDFQLALSFFRISSTVKKPEPMQKPLYLNFYTHEVGIDFHRMDPAHPSHRMYFQRDDVAHQALIAAISSSISLGENIDEHDKLIYIPMATTTIKTTLPSKTMTLAGGHRDAAERNSNVIFANFVITSPSMDLEPRHLSNVLALLQARGSSSSASSQNKHFLMSRLLPKAVIKLSVHEPVLRFALPTSDPPGLPDYNLLVSSISSISLDIESSHSVGEGAQYSLVATYRISSHLIYYQTASGVRHRLLATDTMDLKCYINATTEIAVAISGSMNSFSIHILSGEVTRGLHEAVKQLKRLMPSKQNSSRDTPSPSLLRHLPPWLIRFQFESSAFSIEIAGSDPTVGPATRGIVLHLGGWSVEYQLQKPKPNPRSMRRRTPSHSAISDDPFRFTPTSPSGKSYARPSDGRRLAFHVRQLESFIMESVDYMEPDAFLSVPQFEVALTTSSDLQGPIFHINSTVNEIIVKHSLYRCYAIGIAATAINDAFFKSTTEMYTHGPKRRSSSLRAPGKASSKVELTTFDIKVPSIQVQGVMPSDPRMLLQVYGLVAGRHRWSPPFIRSHLIRLHVEPPKVKGTWTRIISVGGVRVGLRESRTKQAETLGTTKSYDISSDFIRVAVPPHMIMYRVFDNFVNTVKALELLSHRMQTKSSSHSTEKPPSGPKRVPKISLRSKSMVFEIEDDPFEWKLGCIYRLGLQEQKQRLAREEAYHMKLKKVRESHDDRYTTIRLRSLNARSLTDRPYTSSRRSGEYQRSTSADSRPRKRSRSRGRSAYSKGRYDTGQVPNFSDCSILSADEAWNQLQAHNARSWKKKIDHSIRFQNAAVRELRALFVGADKTPDGIQELPGVAPIPSRPGLLAIRISDFAFSLDAPSFPLHEYPQYLHRIGKGMPLDMKYALLIPMSIRLDMGEARFNLRDYPLDLIHIPPLGPGQSARVPAWSLKTDFVIAEEFRGPESSRQVIVNIVPPSLASDGTMQDGFSLDVRRTVAPVKTYSNPTIEINTNQPTTISWGMSYQPAIQDVMKIIENFTKPEIDPSERVGFWDKIRLSFHSRLLWVWKGDGDVHFRLKGSRDPYIVTGFGAGFVMCWRKDVQWGIHTNDDPQEFFAVTSGEYVLAIPDYNRQARYSYECPSFSSGSSRVFAKNDALFKKVIMKLSGNVRWLAGLVFERNTNGADRCFDFKPHYEVVLRNPTYLNPETLKDYDAFRGFRSNHIHLSLAVVAPVSRVWTLTNREPSASYNTVHLTPKFFTHFFSWWSLFSGVMSLPVRQGPLFPGLTKTSKKFSRHLGTIKYKLFLSPLFVSHIYKHKDPEDYKEDVVFATGLKVRLDSFMLDLHQRREYTTVVKGRLEPTKASSMKINRAQLDFISADCRAVSSIGSSLQGGGNEKDGISPTYPDMSQPAEVSNFTIPDDDLNWIDMDDFVELDWVLPSELNPKTQILPLAYSPRFSFFRQTDHIKVGPDEPGYSPFGDEPTHVCVMSQDHDPRRVQIELLKERLSVLEAQSSSHQRVVGEFELRSIRDGITDEETRRQYETLVRHGISLAQRQRFLQDELQRLEKHLIQNNYTNGAAIPGSSEDGDLLLSSAEDEFGSDFDNRFVIHNIQLKWNNSLRNIILRYIHQVNQRRGFVYYMSRRAVKFILDIVDEQAKTKRRHMGKKQQTSWTAEPRSPIDIERGNDMTTEERIEQLLNDASRFVNAEPPTPGESKHPLLPSNSSGDIASEFTPQNSYHLRLIAPQIQLQSEKNKKSVAVVTAKGMQLKVVSIMDKHRVSDDISGLVQRQFTLSMDSAQFFVADQKSFTSHIHIYCGNGYGNAPGTSWPPWVSVEAMFDFDIDLSGFSRIIQKTSASLRYDKFNTLRLKFNERVAGEMEEDDRHDNDTTEHRMDQITVDFPQVRAICDSSQYYSLYIIALDLLMYSEPREQVRAEKLEKIMLASDFSDLRGAPEIVNRLQQRIRYLEEIKSLFQIRAKYLDKQGLADRSTLEKDLITCEDELFFMMKAITTSQRKGDDRAKSSSSGLLHWTLAASEIVWHLMTDNKEPIAEFQLRDAAYGRTDNIDGSNHNTIEVGNIYGLNLLPDALYPQVILPYKDDHRGTHPKDNGKMLQVKWYMLEAIAGIPVLNDFEVTLFPLKIQLERELGQKLFEYAFPAAAPNAFENGGFSPFMIKQIDPPDDESDIDGTSGVNTPALSTTSTSTDERPTSRLGTVEQRLTPTLALPDKRRSYSPGRIKKSMLMTPIIKDPASQKHDAEDCRSGSASQVPTRRTLAKKASADSLTLLKRQASDWSLASQAGNKTEEKLKRPTLKRQPTKVHLEKTNGSDDLSRMISRASNFMILTHVKINDVVLCLSYKGKGERNIEDIHDFVFRLPVLEYRNKSWSNLDLALRLKKDAIKALISHAPAILGNKFSHHRPTKQQQKRLRELASSSQLLDGQSILSTPHSDGSNSIVSRTSTERSVSPALSLNSRAFQASGASSTDSMGIPARTKTAHSDLGPMGSASMEEQEEEQSNKLGPPRRRFTTSRGSASSENGDDVSERQRRNPLSLFGRKILGSLD